MKRKHCAQSLRKLLNWLNSDERGRHVFEMFGWQAQEPMEARLVRSRAQVGLLPLKQIHLNLKTRVNKTHAGSTPPLASLHFKRA